MVNSKLSDFMPALCRMSKSVYYKSMLDLLVSDGRLPDVREFMRLMGCSEKTYYNCRRYLKVNLSTVGYKLNDDGTVSEFSSIGG